MDQNDNYDDKRTTTESTKNDHVNLNGGLRSPGQQISKEEQIEMVTFTIESESKVKKLSQSDEKSILPGDLTPQGCDADYDVTIENPSYELTHLVDPEVGSNSGTGSEGDPNETQTDRVPMSFHIGGKVDQYGYSSLQRGILNRTLKDEKGTEGGNVQHRTSVTSRTSGKRHRRKARKSSSSSSASTSTSSESYTETVTLQEVAPEQRGVTFKETVEYSYEPAPELFSMDSLSRVVSPKVMKRIRSSISKVYPERLSGSLELAQVIVPDPSVKWEEKQKRKLQRRIRGSQIKSGWRVKKALACLEPPQTINTYYMELVEQGNAKDLGSLLRMSKANPRLLLNVNYTDEQERSALWVAIKNRDAVVCEVLMKHKIRVADCVFHAIQSNFIAGIEVILAHDNCLATKIKGENYYFPVGITPMMFAASCNNYAALRLFYQHGHQLPKPVEWADGIRLAWESANERRLICSARSSPAYITFWSEVYSKNPMQFCISQIRAIKENALLEQEYSDFYQRLKNQIENYMCSLLDQIRSSEELAQLFQYDFQTFATDRQALQAFADGSTTRDKVGVRLELLDRASTERLMKFVTHPNSQLSLTYLRYRYVPFLRRGGVVKRVFMQMILGLLFPFFSLCYLIAPSSKLGSLLTLPIISFGCHMVSEITFIVCIFANVVSKSMKRDYLGSPPTPLEYMLLLWILGKLFQEFQECFNRGFKKYFSDAWNWNDIAQLTFFTVAIIFRVIDYAQYGRSPKMTPRPKWTRYEPRLMSEVFLAWAYVFCFLRILGMGRADRTLGPLQVSLARMMTNIMHFLLIFALVIFSFGLGLSELYWFYGTVPGKQLPCRTTGSLFNQTYMNQTFINATANLTTSTSSNTCKQIDVGFSTISQSLLSLFWAIFGQVDLTKLSLLGQQPVTEASGRVLLAAYHISAILVLINMLIAMMAKTYEDTSQNEENEWKFHRTAMWIRFIRREVVRPPPMNLIPNPYRAAETFSAIKKLLRSCCCKTPIEEQEQPKDQMEVPGLLHSRSFDNLSQKFSRNLSRKPTRSNTQGTSFRRPASFQRACRDVISSDLRKQRAKRVMMKLVRRYKYRVFYNRNVDCNVAGGSDERTTSWQTTCNF